MKIRLHEDKENEDFIYNTCKYQDYSDASRSQADAAVEGYLKFLQGSLPEATVKNYGWKSIPGRHREICCWNDISKYVKEKS